MTKGASGTKRRSKDYALQRQEEESAKENKRDTRRVGGILEAK